MWESILPRDDRSLQAVTARMSLTVPTRVPLSTWQGCQVTKWYHLDSLCPFSTPFAKLIGRPQISELSRGQQEFKVGPGKRPELHALFFSLSLWWKIPSTCESKTWVILQAASRTVTHTLMVSSDPASFLPTFQCPVPSWNKPRGLCNFIHYGFISFP